MWYLKRAYFLLIVFYLPNILAQDQNMVESLKNRYETVKLTGSERFNLLYELAFHSAQNLDESLGYADILIKEAQQDSNYFYLCGGYKQKGQTYRMAGDMQEALEAFFKACEVASKLEDKKYLGGGYLAIADVYSEIENVDNAKTYYKKSIDILRKTDDSLTLGTALLNSGYDKFINSKFNEALIDYKESSVIFKNKDYPIGTAYNMGNIGMVYAELGKDDLAMKNINNAIEILEKYEDYYAISEYLASMSNVYVKQNKISKALEYDHKSLDLAKKYRLKKQISESNLSLSELYENLGNWEASYEHYRNYIVYRDSIRNLEVIEKMADQRTDYEVGQKQVELDLETQKRKNQRIIMWSSVGVLFLTSLLAYGLFRRNKFVKATNKIISTERERSDKLLLNILPEDTAQELKDKGSVEAKQYPSVTVLFTDFVGFTSYAEGLSPADLVKTIDHYFSEFDLIMQRYGLEKIKTIGDAYMAVGGLSFDTVDQAKDMVLAAKDMVAFVAQSKDDSATTASFDIRIGINTGPVVAGVVGTKKFAYDIWGDSVNIASRMESNSEAGRINISENTYSIVKDDFDCEYRGELAVKNRGHLKMYFIA